MYFVSDVSRNPRKTVSSSSGASTAVTVKRLRYVGVLIRMMRATASTVPPPPALLVSCSQSQQRLYHGKAGFLPTYALPTSAL